jgi:hypothetical protein
MSTKNKIEITRENKNLGWAWKQWTPNDPEPPTEPDYGGTLSHVLNRIYWDRAFQCAKNACKCYTTQWFAKIDERWLPIRFEIADPSDLFYRNKETGGYLFDSITAFVEE